MSEHYGMDGQPISFLEWGEQFEDIESRRIGDDTIGGVRISTVWLGIDHNFSGQGPPLIFETMVFGMSNDEEWMERYSTREQAEQGHARVVEAIKAVEE